MVAGSAVNAIVLTVFVMPPLGRFEFHMVAGYAGGEVVDALGVGRFECFVKGDPVAGSAALYIFPRGGIFVVAFLTLDFVLRGVDLVVKNNFSARIFQKDTGGHGLRGRRNSIPHKGYQGCTDNTENNGNIAFLQGDPSLALE